MSAPIPFNNLAIQWREIAAEANADIAELFVNSAFSHGRYVEAFEHDVADWLDTPHAIAVNSGTSALHLAMLAAGIGPGDEVLVPAHTFIATIWGVLYVGATPVLCDVEEATCNIDVADAERRISARTAAIIPVHLYGQPADLGAVMALAARHGLKVVEDNAQSIGAAWSGRMCGTHGLMGCFSFYPGKNLGAAGEGGMVVTADDEVAARLSRLRSHGETQRYLHAEIGYNYRMDGIQGIILRHKLRRLHAWTERRRQLAARYRAALQFLPLRVPEIRHQDHVWHLYVIRTDARDALRAHLQADDIATGLHYPVPNHRQPCLVHLPLDPAGYPVADVWASQGLSLPLFYGMTDAEVDRVGASIGRFFGRN
ncbi:MAG TPA: DegT/DnrJ/EryC1/StrS family aminotransferase [Acetobacteraceae bacterium]|nr:DegT/DnrJ/EryC1/StrS family aminotransferase [Acetobacteraceae bacterium]